MKPNFLLRMASFFWPVLLERHSSVLNPVLEIALNNGRVVLNSARANYSRGALHAVMRRALKMAKRQYGCKFHNVLMLGYGGGSAAYLIRKHFNTQAKITAVEIDSDVVALARQWFPVSDVNFYVGDAKDFLEQTNERYDLIICDIFIDLNTPEFAMAEEFYKQMALHLVHGGLCIQNLMLKQSLVLQQLSIFGKVFPNPGLVNVQESNRLFFGTKGDR